MQPFQARCYFMFYRIFKIVQQNIAKIVNEFSIIGKRTYECPTFMGEIVGGGLHFPFVLIVVSLLFYVQKLSGSVNYSLEEQFQTRKVVLHAEYLKLFSRILKKIVNDFPIIRKDVLLQLYFIQLFVYTFFGNSFWLLVFLLNKVMLM